MKKAIVSVIVSLCFVCGLVAQTKYELVVLDESSDESCAYGINSFGYIVGYKFVDGMAVPFLWDSAKGFSQLQVLPGMDSLKPGIAYAINDSFAIAGTFAGSWGTGLNVYHLNSGYGVVWLFDDRVSDFVPFEVSAESCSLRDISNTFVLGGTKNSQAYVFDVPAGEQRTYGYFNYIFGVNDQGNAAGNDLWGSSLVPVFFKKESDGSHTIQRAPDALGYGGGVKISNSNQIVGVSGDRGFYWEPETGFYIRFESGTGCHDINSAGHVVGMNATHALMWTKEEGNSFVVTDLNSLVARPDIVLEQAFGINDSGQIVGRCRDVATGIRHAFMLTPSKEIQASIAMADGSLVISWPSQMGHVYVMKMSEDLVTWTNLEGSHTADGPSSQFVTPLDRPKVFFRVFDLTP